MKSELQKKLYEKYPKIFRQKDLSMRETCMCWGIECPDSWYHIIDCLCFRIQCICDKGEKKYVKYPFGNFLSKLFKNPRLYGRWVKKRVPQVEATQVKEKFGCYDEQTEVLTDQGWKFFKDLDKTEKVATLNVDTKEIEYQVPTDYICYGYEGKMYKLVNRGIDLLVTPNHRLYLSKGFYYNGKYKPCKKRYYPYELAVPDKYFGKKKTFLKSGKWIGKDEKTFILPKISWNSWTFITGTRNYRKSEKKINIKNWLEFLGFYVAEGCVTKNGNEISIACCNVGVKGEKETLYLERLLKKLNFPYAITLEDRPAKVYRIYDKQLGKWLLDNCGHLAPNKRTPNFIKELSSNLIKKYLIGLYKGDACKQKTSYILTTTSKTLSNDVQELIFKCGDSSYCSERLRPEEKRILDKIISSKNKCYEINWLKKTKDILVSNQKKQKSFVEEWITYKGKVYCVTVPNHIIYVRRGGKVYWCGNSLRYYYSGGNNSIDNLIAMAEDLTATVCAKCGSTKNVKVTEGWITYLCEDCRRKNEI